MNPGDAAEDSEAEVTTSGTTALGDESCDESEAELELSSRDIFAQLVRFTLPTMAIWMCGPILSMVDTSVVGVASTLELAAMSPGGVFVDYPSYLVSSSLAVATTTLVAQDRMRDAAERRKSRRQKKEEESTADDSRAISISAASSTSSTISSGVALAALTGMALGALLLVVARPAITRFAGPASAAVVPAALVYAQTRCFGMPAALVTSVAQASFLACRSPWQPLAAVAAAGLVNLAGDLVLVCGLGAGIGGAALATVASQAVTAAALLRALLRQGREKMRGEHTAGAKDSVGGAKKHDPGKGQSTGAAVTLPSLDRLPMRIPDAATTIRFLKIAFPVFFLNSIKVVFMASLVQAVTSISPEDSAASGVMSAIYFFFAVMGDGVSQAAQTFLPPVLGTQRAAKTALLLLASALCLGCCSAVISSAIATGLPSIFTSSEAVMAIMKTCAPIMSFTLLLHTASMGSEGCLLSARDTRFMTLCYAPNSAAAYVTLKLCIGDFGMGAAGLWVALAQFHLCRLLANAFRLFLYKRSPLLRAVAQN